MLHELNRNIIFIIIYPILNIRQYSNSSVRYFQKHLQIIIQTVNCGHIWFHKTLFLEFSQ